MNAIETFVPGAVYYLNPTTKRLECTDKTIDYDAVMKTAQEQFEALKKNPVGNHTLTDGEINELAQKYDPRKMTQNEYDDFIRYLEEKGVLSELETCDIGMSFTRVIPGYNGLTESIGTPSTQWLTKIHTLADTKGNALQFVQAKSQLQVLGYNGQIQRGAYSKVLDIFNQMSAVRAGTVSSQASPTLEENVFLLGRSVSTGERRLTVSALMGDLSSFQLAMDRVKNGRIQTV